jgi:DNA polymerase
MNEKETQLASLIKEISNCVKCPLHAGRHQAVPGEGSARAKIFFVGEGPGVDEDVTGRPFVGRSGRFLREMITTIGLKEEDYFIANVVKCRPPGNRDPDDLEIESCWPYLARQLEIIDPPIIVTLGRHSLGRFLPGFKISAIHGQPKRRQSDGKIILPLYHPAVALYSASQRSTLMEDFKAVAVLLQKLENKEI